jgi:hypothetical protein
LSQVCSMFSQILQMLSRLEFEHLVRQHKAELPLYYLGTHLFC